MGAFNRNIEAPLSLTDGWLQGQGLGFVAVSRSRTHLSGYCWVQDPKRLMIVSSKSLMLAYLMVRGAPLYVHVKETLNVNAKLFSRHVSPI